MGTLNVLFVFLLLSFLGSVMSVRTLKKDSLSFDCPPTGDHYFSHENCTKFIVCSNGVYTEFTCPEGTYWDQENKICDYDDTVCSGNPTDPPTEETEAPEPDPIITTTEEAEAPSTSAEEQPTTTENLFPCPETGYHTLPHYSMCNLYYRCFEGDLFGIFSCGPEEWFDSRTESCVDPGQSDCPY